MLHSGVQSAVSAGPSVYLPPAPGASRPSLSTQGAERRCAITQGCSRPWDRAAEGDRKEKPGSPASPHPQLWPAGLLGSAPAPLGAVVEARASGRQGSPVLKAHTPRLVTHLVGWTSCVWLLCRPFCHESSACPVQTRVTLSPQGAPRPGDLGNLTPATELAVAFAGWVAGAWVGPLHAAETPRPTCPSPPKPPAPCRQCPPPADPSGQPAAPQMQSPSPTLANWRGALRAEALHLAPQRLQPALSHGGAEAGVHSHAQAPPPTAH